MCNGRDVLKSTVALLTRAQRHNSIRIETDERIDIRGIILAAELPVVCFGTTAEMFPESMLVATHKIGRCTNEKGRGLRRHSLPWGGAGPENGKFDEASTGCTSPYIIHVEDLERFSMGLMGGDNAYIRFAKCTKHTITFHDAGFQAKYPDLAEWSRNKILRAYSKRLVGFDRFRVLHRGSTIQLDEVARQPVLDRDFISGHLAGRLSEGRRPLVLERRRQGSRCVHSRCATDRVVG